MASSFFDPEKGIWPVFSLLLDILVLSLLWMFCSLPVVTAGAATAALYDAAARGVRVGEKLPYLRFFRTFRRELVPSIILEVFLVVPVAVLLWVLTLLWQAVTAELPGASLVLAAFAVLLLIPLGAVCWAFPLLSRFELTPPAAVLMSLRFAVGYLHYTVVCVIVTALAALSVFLLLVPVAAVPCLTALVWSLMMERAFRRSAPPEDGPPGPV